jgi:branched-chain amino acid transport system permease protein
MLQILVNGTISGLVLALLALGFQFVFLPTRTFHIAAAGVYTVAPYVAMSVLQVSGSWIIAVGVSLVAVVAVSGLCELLNHRRLERREASAGAHMISSLGLSIIIVQIVAMIWGNDSQTLRQGLDASWRLSGIVLTRAQLIAALGSLAILLGMGIFLRHSELGIRYRALSDNPTEFALLGFNIHAYRLGAFCLSGLLVGMAALLTANDVGFEPYGGLHALLLAIVAVIIGGKGSFFGPVAGGFMLGILRTCVVYCWSARWQDVITFLLLAVFLYVLPQGLFSVRTRLEAAE